MKNKLLQIKFVDKQLLPLFGIQSIIDYNSKISLNDIKKNINILNQLNNIMNTIKLLFSIKEFNLHKTDYIIKTYTQAYALFKKCLLICNINFEIISFDKINYVRLIKKNILLKNYINTIKMSDVRELSKIPTKSENFKVIKYQEFLINIKKENLFTYYLPMNKMHHCDDKSELSFFLNNFINCDFKGLSIDFISDNNIISNEYLKQNIYGSNYNIIMNGYIIYESVLIANKNLFPDVILPFSLNKYSQIKIVIFSKIPFLLLKNILTVKLTVTRVIFKKKLLSKFTKNNLLLKIPFNNNYLIFKNGIFGFFENSISLNNEENVKGNFINILDYTCFRINEIRFDKNYGHKCLSALIQNNCDFVFCNIIDCPINSTFYTFDNDIYTFKHIFIRNGDAIDNIIIKFPFEITNDLTIQLISIELSDINDSNLIIENLDYEKINGTNIYIKNKKIINLVSYQGGVYLEFNCKFNNINKLFDELKINYDVIFADTKLRNNFINIKPFKISY